MCSRNNFPIECLEDIFRHLRGNYLLKCALVCPQWNNFIGSTKSCMKKINLRCENRFNNLKRLKTPLMTSKRMYSRATVGGDYCEEMHEILSMDNRKWTHILSTDYLKFETTNDVFEFLRVFQSSIEVLTLRYAEVEENRDRITKPVFESQNVQFPKLKTLVVGDKFTAFFDKLFSNCENLESLGVAHLQPCDHTKTSLEAIRNSLNSNKRLKKLELVGWQLFKDNFSSTNRCKLTEFRLRSDSVSLRPQIEQNLSLFLKTQNDSLEVLQFDRFVGHDVMNTILSMPRLKKLQLCLRDVENLAEIAETWPTSHSIVDLNCCGLRDYPPVWNAPLLKSFPKVETLKILELDNATADLMPRTYKFLKKLWVIVFSANTVSNEAFYSNLEEFNCVSVQPMAQELFDKLNGRVIAGFHN